MCPGASEEMRDGGSDASGPQAASAFGLTAGKPAVIQEEC